MARRVITLMGDPIINEEEKAIEALTPGHIVEFSGAGIRKNTANAANVARAIALEREELGKDIDVAYASGDTVKVGVFKAGERAYVFLASGSNAAKGDYLTTDNAGLFTKTGVTTALRLARALEAVDATAGPVAGTRVRVEFI